MTTPPLTIDAHAHVFRRGLKLAAGRRYAPDYDAPLELYLEHLDRNGLSHGVLVQPSFLGTDNSYLVESLRKADGRLRGVAVVDPAVSRDEMARLEEAGIVGIRLNLLGQPLPDLSTREWGGLIERVASVGWHVEVQRRAADLPLIVPRLLELGAPVVLDHFALPPPETNAADQEFGEVLKLGATRDVWVKMSAPYRCGPESERMFAHLFPRLRDAFGLDRLMWGSDWPHTQHERSQTYEANRQLLSRTLDAEDVAAVLAAPRDLFRF